MKTEAETEVIIDHVLQELDWTCASQAERADPKHRRKRDAVRKYGRKFARRMNGANPFATEDQACKVLAPIFVWGLWQIGAAFAQWIIKRLWARWHEPPQ